MAVSVSSQHPTGALETTIADSNIEGEDNSLRVAHPSFEPFIFEGQQNTTDFGLQWSARFPLALHVQDVGDSIPASNAKLRELTESGELRRLVRQHGGAILFRGLPLKTPDDYSKVAHAFGFRHHVEVGRPPLRTLLAPNVKTANEGPPELPIWPHNEYGWSTINPAWLTFSALKIPEQGGATPITSSIYIAYQLSKLRPAFLSELLSKGAKYTYRYTVNTLVSNTGTSIRGAYGEHVTDDDTEEVARQKVETEIRRHSNNFEWHADGSLSVTHVVPAIRIHSPSDATVFFGNLTSAWGRSRHHGATRPPFQGDDGSYHPPPQFGDGTAMDVEDLDLLLDIAEQGAVDVVWQQGDLVLLDNYAVQHSRKPWKGERQVLAALWDDDGRVKDFEEGEKLLKAAPKLPILS